jgi:hypothetical protein
VGTQSLSAFSNRRENKAVTMGDEDDFVIESTDAGATATIPMEAGQVKKGGEPRNSHCVSSMIVM